MSEALKILWSKNFENKYEELAWLRRNVKDCYFTITYNARTLKWVVSLPQARYRLKFEGLTLEGACAHAIAWIRNNARLSKQKAQPIFTVELIDEEQDV